LVGSQQCTPKTWTAYPGAKCPTGVTCNLDVGSGTTAHCVKGVCTGKAKGAACAATSECAPGYWCKSSVCTAQVSEDLTCATSGSRGECKNDLVCTSDLKCAKALNTSKGDKCTVDLECKYGVCGVVYCYEIESDNDYPHTCSTDNDCMSKKHKVYGTDADVQVPGSCKCGKNPNGTKYCNQFNYDYYAKK
jgi:hypothetical protein